MNKVLLIGRITANPELLTTSSGVSYTRFTIAVSRTYNNEKTDFIPVVAWRQSADFIVNYINKGNLISVEGSFTSSTYAGDDSQNITRYNVSADRVQILERKRDQNSEVNFKEHVKNVTKNISGVGNIEFEPDNNSQKKDENSKTNEKLKENNELNDVPWDIEL